MTTVASPKAGVRVLVKWRGQWTRATVENPQCPELEAGSIFAAVDGSRGIAWFRRHEWRLEVATTFGKGGRELEAIDDATEVGPVEAKN